MPSTSYREFLIGGIILVAVGCFLTFYNLVDITDFTYVSFVIGIVVLVLGLCILAKGLSIRNAMRGKETSSTPTAAPHDNRPHYAPSKCLKCGGIVVNRRCSSCQTAWCSNCGTMSDRGALRCSSCHRMLPP